MKNKKVIFSLAAASLLLPACKDEVMVWNEPDSTVRPQELPLELAEKISRYDYIKEYMAQYHPNVDITVGMGLDNFLSDEQYQQTVLDNFQGCTFGNALKHQSVVQSNGSYNWATIDRFIAMNTGLKWHGHNMIWHTQQQQPYLKSLIAPEMVVVSDPTSDIINLLSGDASNFDGGTKGGWGSWGGDSSSDVASPGRGDEGYCMILTNLDEGSDYYVAQAAYTMSDFLTPDTYKIRFYAKSDNPAGSLQFSYQNSSTYSGGGYHAFDVGTDWTLCEYEFELTQEDVDRILINFGKIPANYYVDDVEFGVVNPDAGKPADPMINVLPASASDFEGITDGSTGGWGSWGGGKDSVETVEGAGKDGSVGVVLKNTGDGNAWDAQFAYTFSEPLAQNVPYMISFEAKAENPGGSLQFQYQNGTTYGSQGGYNTFELSTDWMPCEYEFTITDYDDVDRIIINFGAVGNTYYLDNIKFGQKIDTGATRMATRAGISYKLKTPEEKYAALDAAMEEWIKEAMYHVGQYCYSYDVINEPIGDDISFRGVDRRGWSGDDREPEESVESGLNLNWESGAGNGHFYWGYYMGMDYAVKAFQYARKYADEVHPEMKLFVNDYNLEISPAKLAKLIQFVEYIDKNGAHVDGIGTQMHVSAKSITKEQVDDMFKTLAATGKLIRITELDVALGTASPSLEEQQLQSDVYQMILESFFENIPEAQQHGITIWSLTDSAKEHEYWLNGDTPNIFDANYGRKIAYKGVCDAIIGFDPSGDWESPDYSNSAASANQ